MVFAPNSCRHRPALATDADYVVLVPARALDRRYVKAKGIAMLVSTFDMDLDTAIGIVAIHASTSLFPTSLAGLVVQSSGYGRDAFAGLECFRIPELDFWVEDGTGNVYPVVICRLLERLPWVDGPTEVFLAFAVEISCLQGHFLLQPLALSLLVRLLLVRNPRGLYKVMLGRLNRTQHTLVMLKMGVSCVIT